MRYTPPKQHAAMWTEDYDAKQLFWRRLYKATDRAVTAWINKPRIGDTRPGTRPATFKPRDHFRADGKPKRGLTLQAAQVKAQEREGMRFYVCSVCGAYHVGHVWQVAA